VPLLPKDLPTGQVHVMAAVEYVREAVGGGKILKILFELFLVGDIAGDGEKKVFLGHDEGVP